MESSVNFYCFSVHFVRGDYTRSGIVRRTSRRRYFVGLGRMRHCLLPVRMTPRADGIQDKTPALPPTRRRHLGLSHASSCCVFVSPPSPSEISKGKNKRALRCARYTSLPPSLSSLRTAGVTYLLRGQCRSGPAAQGCNSDGHTAAPWHSFRAVETFTGAAPSYSFFLCFFFFSYQSTKVIRPAPNSGRRLPI